MDSKVITKIKNTVSGSIQLLNASDEIVRILQPIGLTAHGIREGQANEGVCIMNAGGHQEAVLVTANITDYEVYPAASTPFTGDTEDLKALLAESFFFSVSGGGGTVTTEEAQTTIENFSSNQIGQTIAFTKSQLNQFSVHVNPAVYQNLDNATSGTRIGVWSNGIIGGANSYLILQSPGADFIFEADNYFKHTYDAAFKGGNVDYTVDNIFEGIGYSSSTGGGGDKKILDGAFIRPGISSDPDPSVFYLCVAVGGVEEFSQPINIPYIDEFFGRFTTIWDGVNDKFIGSIFDGTQTLTVEVPNFSVNYPTLMSNELYKVIWVETGSVVTNVANRAIIIDRHTEYIKSNY